MLVSLNLDFWHIKRRYKCDIYDLWEKPAALTWARDTSGNSWNTFVLKCNFHLQFLLLLKTECNFWMCLTLSPLLLLFSWKEYRILSWNAQKQKTKATDLWFREKNKRTRKRKWRLFLLIGPCKLQIWRQSWSQASSAAKCFGASSQQQDPPYCLAPELDVAEIIPNKSIVSVVMWPQLLMHHFPPGNLVYLTGWPDSKQAPANSKPRVTSNAFNLSSLCKNFTNIFMLIPHGGPLKQVLFK